MLTNTAQLRIEKDGTINVAGALTFATVEQLWRQSASMLQTSGSLQINLQQVSQSDSAGVALLIEWVREARKQNKAIRFLQVPQQMRAIVRVTGLEKILPIEN